MPIFQDPTVPPANTGYIYKSTPTSVKEAASKFSQKRIKMLSKTALQSYIDSFLSTDNTINRRMLESGVGKVQYFTHKSFEKPVGDDSKIEKPVQLARMYTELKESFPCILIVDAGVRPRPYIGSRMSDARSGKLSSKIDCAVPVTIAVASLDEDTTDLLSSLLSLMFGPLLVQANGNFLCGNPYDGDTWNVSLPYTFEWGALSSSPVEGDNKDLIWSCSFDMELSFEDTVSVVVQDVVTLGIEGPAALEGVEPIIEFPTSLKISEKETIRVRELSFGHRVILDSPGVATFDPETYLLTPRALGSFRILVVDSANKIVTSKDVQITLT